MKKQKLNKLAVKWAEKIGRNKALSRLIEKNFSASLADKIISDRYSSELHDMYASVLIQEMKKDGISLTDEVAS